MKNLLILCLIVVSSAVVSSAQSKQQKASLSGIKYFKVIISVDKNKLLSNYDKYDIERDVKSKLRASTKLHDNENP